MAAVTTKTLALALASLLLASSSGCGRPGAAPLVPITNGLLLAIADSQKFLVYGGDSSSGRFSFWARMLPSGPDVPVMDPGDQVALYGDLAFSEWLGGNAIDQGIWTRALSGAFPLGKDVWNFSSSDDGSTVFYWQGVGVDDSSGALKMIRTRECAGNTCPSTILLDHTPLNFAASSPDGRYGAYDSDGIRLFSVEQGTTVRIADSPTGSTGSACFFFSPDSARLVLLNESGAHLRVFSTGGGTELPWAQPPPGRIEQIEFLDSSTIATAVVDTSGQETAAFLSASRATPLPTLLPFEGSSPVRWFVNRWRLLIETTNDVTFAGSRIAIQDLSVAPPRQVILSEHGGLVGTDDGFTRLLLFEDVSTDTFNGTLVLLSLPDGSRLAEFANIPAILFGGAWRGEAAQFAAGTNTLLYLDATSRLHVFQNGADSLITEGVNDFRTVPGTIFMTLGDDALMRPSEMRIVSRAGP